MTQNNTTLAQQATISSATQGVQVVREGFFMPAQAGMQLLPGDRVVAETGARAVIEFTGVNDAMVIENGSAATLHMEVVEPDQPPQWIAGDLFGQGVYFDSNAPERHAGESGDSPSLFGLFGPTGSSGGEGSFPLAEAAVGLLAVGAIAGDYNSNDTASSTGNAQGSENPPPPDGSGNGGNDGGNNGGNDGNGSGGDSGGNSSALAPVLEALPAPVADAVDGLATTLAPADGGLLSAIGTAASPQNSGPWLSSSNTDGLV
ncbi:hypothetical protein [Limnobacter sp.]|uniref:hypothetical protein n=1 Tax=Limnobacter sp. TaxID=2003368 RepID=UPI0035150980